MLRRSALAALLLSLFAPTFGWGRTVTVDPDSAKGDYTSIVAALADAAESDSDIDTILVHRGTYGDAVTLVENVTLTGEEAAATKILGPVAFANGAVLERFTLGREVTLTRVISATIRNNLFIEIQAAALQIDPGGLGDLNVDIVNNTFYGNTKAIEMITDSEALVRRNIFVGHDTAITRPASVSGTFRNNHFFANTRNINPGSLDDTNTTGDPKFVSTDTATRDLHLLQGQSSACGLGAYGGGEDDVASPDPTPAPPTGLSSKELSDGKIELSWDENAACDSDVSVYRVKFRSASDSEYTQLDEVDPTSSSRQSFVVDPAALDPGSAPSAPATPTSVTVSPLDGAVQVAWAAVTGADGYAVYSGADPNSLSRRQDAGSSTKFVVDGLENGTAHYAAVAAYVGSSLDFAVSAVPVDAPYEGSDGESRLSDSVEVVTGEVESAPSAATSAVPETVAGFPDLDDNGTCFVTLCGRSSSGVWALAALGLAALGAARFPRPGRLLCVALALCLLAPGGALAASPRWALSAFGGVFLPRQPQWTDHYDDEYLWEGKLGAGFRLLPWLELGAEAGYHQAEGDIETTTSGTPITPSLKQTLHVVPLQAYVLVQYYASQNQWLVPYVAGGYSWTWYQREIKHGDTITGHQDGYHGRAGLKILLDALDPYYAQRASQHWRLLNTYLALEAQYTRVDDLGDTDTNLGGVSYYAGFVVEF